MKLQTHSISIPKGSNKAITSSEDNVSSLRSGTYLRVANDNIFYTIVMTRPIFLVKDFVSIAPQKILLKDNIRHVFHKGDIINISYKEHEILGVFNIINAGQGYKVDDEVYLSKGDLAFDIETNRTEPALFKVNEIGPHGEIISFGILSMGKYINPPPKQCSLLGGNGENAIFEIESKINDNRKLVERSITWIDADHTGSQLTLNYALPVSLKEGKLSIKKSEIILKEIYDGNDQIDVPYEVSRDFTPYLGLALLVKNSLSQEMLINNSFVKLDLKIKELDDKIKELSIQQTIRT